MQVIAGSAKGRKLLTPPGTQTRPTSGRVREALFSILMRYLPMEGAVVLDLFAGSGALGIEALSRGAASGIFVDRSADARKSLRINLQPFCAQTQVVNMDAQQALGFLAKKYAFDLIFLDPPYRENILPQVLSTIDRENCLSAHGVVVCEHSSQHETPVISGNLTLLLKRRFGAVSICLFGRPGEKCL